MTPPSASPPAVDERSFHAWLRRTLASGRTGLLPLGDDTAAFRLGQGRVLLATSDALVEGYHFLRSSPPDAIGAGAVAFNLSDLAAKGGRPIGLLLDLILPPGTEADWAKGVVRGAEKAARRHGIGLVGGDTKPGTERAVVGVALGIGEERHLAPHHGARAGDLLVTTGDVGRGGLLSEALGRTPRRGVLRRILDVTPRLREGEVLVRDAHAMVDTSDGIAEATHLLAEASGCRLVLVEPELPYAPELLRRRGGAAAERRALAFLGGDYELLAALPPARLGAVKRRFGRGGLAPLTVVGRVERGRGAFLETAKGVVPLPRSGWQPFRR